MEVWIVPALTLGGLAALYVLARWGLWLIEMAGLVGMVYLVYRVAGMLF